MSTLPTPDPSGFRDTAPARPILIKPDSKDVSVLGDSDILHKGERSSGLTHGVQAHKSPTLLIVEDSPMIATMTRFFLTPHFPVIATCDRVSLAMKWLKTNKPHISIVDLTLPDGSGMDVIEQIRKLYPSSGIIAYSSSGIGTLKRAMLVGADKIVSKPGTRAILLDAVRETIELRRSAALRRYTEQPRAD